MEQNIIISPIEANIIAGYLHKQQKLIVAEIDKVEEEIVELSKQPYFTVNMSNTSRLRHHLRLLISKQEELTTLICKLS